ncbi:MAG: HDOD domain-containing protein [Ignavibacteriae bacterium]|nr:HDOD domain-containing protein [Ignavibacteriota bacterium]
MQVTTEQIYSKLNKIQNLPTIPEIMFDAISIIKSEPGNVIKISEIIGKDQGMATKILSVANSPLYGMLRKVSTLEFAIMIMGSNELEKIVTAISLSNAIRFKPIPNFNEQDYWKHSMAVGLVAKDIARRLGFPEIAGDAFVGGILHDIGIQLIVKYFPEEFQQIYSNLSYDKKFIECENKILGISHQEMGAFLLKKWNLPSSIFDCVQYHHEPENSLENKELVSVVHLADFITNEFNTGKGFWDQGIELNVSLCTSLGFDSHNDLVGFYSDYSELVTDTVDSIHI